MIPKTKNTYNGIEIEFISVVNEKECNAILKELGIHSICELGYDGSIECNEYIYNGDTDEYEDFEKGYELRVLTKRTELKPVLDKVGVFLKKVKAFVNYSCGLHVHLDVRNKDIISIYSNLLNKQDEMIKSLPSYRKDNSYCQRVGKDSLFPLIFELSYLDEILKPLAGSPFYKLVKDSLIEANEYSEYYFDSYDGISVDQLLSGRYNTIEVRFHEGTVDTNEIYKWCTYLNEIAYDNKLSRKSKNYINKRIALYGT